MPGTSADSKDHNKCKAHLGDRVKGTGDIEDSFGITRNRFRNCNTGVGFLLSENQLSFLSLDRVKLLPTLISLTWVPPRPMITLAS